MSIAPGQLVGHVKQAEIKFIGLELMIGTTTAVCRDLPRNVEKRRGAMATESENSKSGIDQVRKLQDQYLPRVKTPRLISAESEDSVVDIHRERRNRGE